MGWIVALGGVAGAVALGLGLGGALQPTLASRAEGPVESVIGAPAETGPVDLTPAYVSPQSLAAARTLDSTPPPVGPDAADLAVRRELRASEAELRASEAELARYSEAARAAAGSMAAGRTGDSPDPAPSASASRETPSPVTGGEVARNLQ